MRKAIPVGPLLLAMVIAGQGCFMVPARLDAAGKRVLVIPFQDRRDYYFHSADGLVLAKLAAKRLKDLSPRTDVVDAELARSELALRKSANPHWEELGRSLACDYIVIGEILSLTARDPAFIGLLKGKLVTRVTVFDVSADSFCYQETLASQYPPATEPYGIPVHDASEDFVRQAVIALGADQIAGIFVAHRRGAR